MRDAVSVPVAAIIAATFTSGTGLGNDMSTRGTPRVYVAQVASDRTSGGAQPPAAPADASNGTPAAILDDQEVDSILGKNIRSNTGETMGRIIDVLVSRAGKVRGVVIDFGGFLGVGSRKIALDWNVVHFDIPDKSGQITIDLTKDQLRVAPEYKPGEPIVILGAGNPPPTPATPPPAPGK